MSEWISVKDRLPDSDMDTFYICKLTSDFLSSPGMYRTNPYDVVSGRYLVNHTCIYTHWMPLPELPK